MCVYDEIRYKCDDPKQYLQHRCGYKARTGRTCHQSSVGKIYYDPGDCRLCEETNSKLRARKREQDYIKKWRKENLLREALIASSQDIMRGIDRDVRNLRSEREARRRRL